jgi:hypothetical protein
MNLRAGVGVVVAALSAVAVPGCGSVDEAAPPVLDELRSAEEVLFLVGNEVHAIRLDGTYRRSLGKVGHNKYRTAWPRFLPSGDVAVLADQKGAIYPFVGSARGGDFLPLMPHNVTIFDSLCGARLGGDTHLIFTYTPFTLDLPTRTTLNRIRVPGGAMERVWTEIEGHLADLAAFDDGHVLAVRTRDRTDGFTIGNQTIEVIPVTSGALSTLRDQGRVLAGVPRGDLAASPARLPDGRVIFLQIHDLSPSLYPVGEIMVVERDGSVHPSGLRGVVAVTVIGDQVVYEAGGANGVSDLIVTDLSSPPYNLTNTPHVSEHLGWSD